MASLAELQAEFDRRQGAQPQAVAQPVQQTVQTPTQQPDSNLQALEAEFARRQSLTQGVQDDTTRRDTSISPDNVGAGIPETNLGGVSLEDIDAALLKVPGVPQLAEFAAGANRSIAGFLDFLGPDNINAVLELAGSEKRVPNLQKLSQQKVDLLSRDYKEKL